MQTASSGAWHAFGSSRPYENKCPFGRFASQLHACCMLRKYFKVFKPTRYWNYLWGQARAFSITCWGRFFFKASRAIAEPFWR